MKELNGITTNSISTMPYSELIKDQSSINPSSSSITETSMANQSTRENIMNVVCSLLCNNGMNNNTEFSEKTYNKLTLQLIQQAVDKNTLSFDSLSFNVNGYMIKVIFFDTREARDEYSRKIIAPDDSYNDITLEKDIFCYGRRDEIMSSYLFAFQTFSEYTQLRNRIYNEPKPYEVEERKSCDSLFLKALKHLCHAPELNSSCIHNLDRHEKQFTVISLEDECDAIEDAGTQYLVGTHDSQCELQRDTNLPARYNIKIKESHSANSNDAPILSTQESSLFKQPDQSQEVHKDIDVKKEAPTHNEEIVTKHANIVQDSQEGIAKVQYSKGFLRNFIDFTKETYKVFSGYLYNIKGRVGLLFKNLTTKKV